MDAKRSEVEDFFPGIVWKAGVQKKGEQIGSATYLQVRHCQAGLYSTVAQIKPRSNCDVVGNVELLMTNDLKASLTV